MCLGEIGETGEGKRPDVVVDVHLERDAVVDEFRLPGGRESNGMETRPRGAASRPLVNLEGET